MPCPPKCVMICVSLQADQKPGSVRLHFRLCRMVLPLCPAKSIRSSRKLSQVAFHIIGHDTTITMAAEAGQMELNAFEPVVFYNLFDSITTLTHAVDTLTANCILGITANEKRCRELLDASVGITTALCPYIGYKKAASLAKESLKTDIPVKTLVLKYGLLKESELDSILDPYAMTEARTRQTQAKAV